MRWLKLPWRGRAASDELDPDLLATFEGASSIPAPGQPDLARARAHVAAKLEESAAAGGWRKRLALAAFGGGGMWASLVGVAAAHKVAAIGLGVAALVGAGTVAQTGGLDAVLDATGIHASQQGQGHGGDGDDGNDDGDAGGGVGTGVGVTLEHEGGVGPSDASGATVEVSEAPSDLPGNLVTQIHENRFMLRAVLCAVGEGDVTLATAGDCSGGEETTVATSDVGEAGLVTLTLGDEARVSVPGTRSPNGGKPEVTTGALALATLDDYEGRLVFVRGTCEEDQPLADCTVTSVHVLGRAGQSGPGGAGEPQGAGAGDKHEGDPPYGSAPEGVGGASTDDDDGGPSDGAGRPDSVPPVLTPGSQND